MTVYIHNTTALYIYVLTRRLELLVIDRAALVHVHFGEALVYVACYTQIQQRCLKASFLNFDLAVRPLIGLG